MLGNLRKGAAHLDAAERLARWTRQRFGLGDGAVVMAGEVACGLPGCPPLETVVVFWSAEGMRHRYKVFKPVAEVQEDDVPYHWLLRALAAPEGYDGDCC
jgi:hypothetical protein